MALTDKQITDLEHLIDDRGLHDVVAALRDICSDKAVHIRENWQDDGTADPWQQAAASLGRLANYNRWIKTVSKVQGRSL